MSIYFDFKTINELTEDNYYRQQREFTLEELSQYNGSNGNPAYVAIEGIVYDISNATTWGGGTHFGLTAGQDLTSQFNSCHGILDILTNAPKVGVLIDDDDMSDMNFESTMPTNRQVNQDKSKFTPDDWIRYITPLVTYALREPSQGMNTQRLYQKIILLGVLVGLGRTPQEAINQVQEWQNTGASQLLKSVTSTGGLGTTGSMGTGGSQGAGFGTGGTVGSTGGGIGTTGGMGTGGSQGAGFGTGETGGSTGGIGTIGGIGTSGGFGTGGSVGTGGTGTAGSTGTGGGMGTGSSTGTSGNTNISNRLYFD